jgi:hypothetical protein
VTDDPIRLDVVRSGGFAGISRSGTVDTSELTPAEAAEVAESLDALHLDELAAASAQPDRPETPDAFRYEVTVSRGERRWDLVLSDPQLPAGLRLVIHRALRPT